MAMTMPVVHFENGSNEFTLIAVPAATYLKAWNYSFTDGSRLQTQTFLATDHNLDFRLRCLLRIENYVAWNRSGMKSLIHR